MVIIDDPVRDFWAETWNELDRRYRQESDGYVHRLLWGETDCPTMLLTCDHTYSLVREMKPTPWQENVPVSEIKPMPWMVG